MGTPSASKLLVISATELGATAVKAAVERAGLKGEQVDKVFMGNVHGRRLNADTIERKGNSYVGKRARLKRSDVEAWLADGEPPAPAGTPGAPSPPRRRARASHSRVLSDALVALAQGSGSR